MTISEQKANIILSLVRVILRYPELRIGQAILNAIPHDKFLYHMEDKDLLKFLNKYSNYDESQYL
jgi:hypothetical protein